ncbi:hypothetical protein E2C01_093503 [Portunus trituberculatus]|uniref:Uncharacterized protein n=1 Tax=Portunus trituberculatus TaxID=210409 RepID=A0A5B7JMW5_PORTR|nr:hypothetical protein [Portunus trituberculatus]
MTTHRLWRPCRPRPAGEDVMQDVGGVGGAGCGLSAPLGSVGVGGGGSATATGRAAGAAACLAPCLPSCGTCLSPIIERPAVARGAAGRPALARSRLTCSKNRNKFTAVQVVACVPAWRAPRAPPLPAPMPPSPAPAALPATHGWLPWDTFS